jgi:hypothetical protein
MPFNIDGPKPVPSETLQKAKFDPAESAGWERGELSLFDQL